METTPLNHNVFTARLAQYIITHHPEKMEDTDFIVERAATAARSFETASMNGMTVDESMDEANRTLFEGLLFSPFRLVREVIVTEFDYTDDDDELDEFALQMLENVQPLIAPYGPDDNFQGSTAYPALYDEIKEYINQYLVRNGIQ